MLAPIIVTKLYIPSLRPKLVHRPRLIERLNQGLYGKLTLIAAPAGFGKTTLISDWVAESKQLTAWLSLDERDSDPARFLTYLVAALQTIAPHVGDDVLRALQSPQPPPIESLLPALINALAVLPNDCLLVLDDYHAVDSRPVDEALAFLLEHLPPQMHLLIATREDPLLPLARLRARSQMTELRVADLRFTPDEAAGFLNQVMGLQLSAHDIDALEARTEGWIAGLQLAAISIQRQPNAAEFIESFTGSHHFVLDYLVEEVLHQQPEHVQTFLTHTAILDRLSGSLCAAVLGDSAVSAQETLEAIERANLFLVPLDTERRWYRYHHLFADLLRQRLHESAAASAMDVAQLHIRASIWYEDAGLELEALQHAIAANDIERAERLIEGNGVPLHFRGGVTPILNWLKSLPSAILDANPALWVLYASALTFIGQPILDIEDKLQAAETALQDAEPDDTNRDLIGQIAAVRSMLAIPVNQIDTIIAQSHRAMTFLHPDNLPVRTAATWTLGYAYQLQGDRAAANEAYAQTIETSERSGNIMFAVAAATCLGQIQEADNQLFLAEQSYRRALQHFGETPWPTACGAYIGLTRVHYQWNDLDATEQYGQVSMQLARLLKNTDSPATCGVLLAYLELARGNAAGATALLAEAEAFVHQNHFAHQMPEVASAQIRTLLLQGNAAAAAQLAQSYDLPLCQARVYLAQGDPSSALALLAPVREQAETKAWVDLQLKAMVLQALSHQANDDQEDAAQVLADALALAQPGGFVRIFVDEGLPMMELLSDALARGVMPDYTRTLLAAFRTESNFSQSSSSQALIEQLSERELEILRLVAQGLSNREICERLFLALDTVKGHNRRIYAKLHVERRTEAVARARDLDLL